ncbi:MAG TPA: NAD(+)/NADH kinase, partial [Gemmatales bacterium]|nr:NAD(+)/NADH kinase [Gemmatales bacterium]
MLRILVFGFLEKAEVQAELLKLQPALEKQKILRIVNLAEASPLPLPNADLALVLGGDGTILRAAQRMAYQQIPTLGINLGKLGFLADVKQHDALEVLENLFQHGIHFSDHLMLECSIFENGTCRKLLGLNEIVVHADPPLHLVRINLSIDGEAVTTFSGDGLIISTPIGSTGHNLSAGGPILQQELSAFVITPICGHALTYRPIVDSAERTFSLSLHRDSNPAVLSIDG